MPEFNWDIARQIVHRALANQTHLSADEIDEHTRLQDDLHLDDAGRVRAANQIIRSIEGLGFPTRFTGYDLLRAGTVGDVIQKAVSGTDSGGPKARP